MKNLKNNNENGLTLVEMLVAFSIFSLVSLIIMQTFSASIRMQRVFLAKTSAVNEVSYLMEYVSRAVRMARKDDLPKCLSASALNFEKTGRNGLRFLNYDDKCQEFYLENNAIIVEKDGIASRLTSPNIKVLSWIFGPAAASQGWTQDDVLQPRVTISLKIEDKAKSEFIVQTTITQRNLDQMIQATP